jgi:hypothetical protein
MITQSGQTIMDVALQETGSIDGVLDIMELNGLALDEHFGPGNDVETPEPKAPRIVEYYRTRGIEIATGDGNELNYPGGSFNDDWHIDFD